MKQGKIKIRVTVDFDGDCTFDLTVSNKSFRTTVRFYGDVDTWKDFGSQLTKFPKNVKSFVEFDRSQNHPFPADSFFLRAYSYNQIGHSAVKVMVDNHDVEPDRYRVEFSFPAEAASINLFGQILLSWDVTDGSEITWEAQTS